MLPIAVAASLAVIAAVWWLAVRGDPNCLPDGWEFREIAAATPGEGGKVRVLAWRVARAPIGFGGLGFEERQSCVTLREFDGGGGFVVAHVFRTTFPLRRSPSEWRSSWEPCKDGDLDPYVFTRWFVARPDNGDLARFLVDLDRPWFSQSTSILDGGICERNWFQAIGEPPTAQIRSSFRRTEPDKPMLDRLRRWLPAFIRPS
jgi:hypothetical protein